MDATRLYGQNRGDKDHLKCSDHRHGAQSPNAAHNLRTEAGAHLARVRSRSGEKAASKVRDRLGPSGSCACYRASLLTKPGSAARAGTEYSRA